MLNGVRCEEVEKGVRVIRISQEPEEGGDSLTYTHTYRQVTWMTRAEIVLLPTVGEVLKLLSETINHVKIVQWVLGETVMWFVSCSGLTRGMVCATLIHQTPGPHEDAIVDSIWTPQPCSFAWRTAGVPFAKEGIIVERIIMKMTRSQRPQGLQVHGSDAGPEGDRG